MRAIAKITILAILAVMGLVYATSCSPDDPQTPTQIVIVPPTTGTKAIVLQFGSSSIPADGVSAVQIIAICTVGGNEAPNGLPVFFTTSNGDFSYDGVDPVNAASETRSITLNTVSGQAVIYLLSSTEPGSATIEATFASEVRKSGSVDFIRTGDEVDSVALKVTPTSGAAPLTAEVEATVTDENNTPLSGVLVRFRATDDAAHFDRSKVKTDSQGVAATFLRNVKRDMTVKATASGIQAQELVTITNDNVVGVELSVLNTIGNLANKDPVLINEQGQLLLQAVVSGEGNTTVNNVIVNFSSTDPNTTFSRKTPKTNSSGEADTTANGIRRDSIITATSGGNSDNVTVKINNRPVPIINILSGQATSGVVNIFTVSAEASYDPEEPYGDSIKTFTWAATMNSSTGATVAVTNTTNAQLRTYTVGSSGGPFPASGDELKIFLTVVDQLNLQQTTVLTITFP